MNILEKVVLKGELSLSLSHPFLEAWGRTDGFSNAVDMSLDLRECKQMEMNDSRCISGVLDSSLERRAIHAHDKG